MLTFLTSSSCQNSNSFYEDLVDFMILKWLAVSDLALKKSEACMHMEFFILTKNCNVFAVWYVRIDVDF